LTRPTAPPARRRNRYELLGLDPAANPVLEAIAAHASCRAYRPDPLPEGTVERLAVAAQSAPTSSNLQAYSIVVVQDPARKRRLYELCGEQPMILDAPLFLVFCPDLRRLEYVCRRQGHRFGAGSLDMFLVATVDAALAAQNAALAAEAMGLGTCMVGAIRERPREVIDLLALPPGVYALVGLCVGYPAARGEVKPRLPLSAVLHRETYSDRHLDTAVAEYDRLMAAAGIYGGRQVPAPGGQVRPEQASYGWAEHTARRLAAARRRELRSVLEAHGWCLT